MATSNNITITISGNSKSAEAAFTRINNAVSKLSQNVDKDMNKASGGFSKLQTVAVAVGNIIANVVSKAFRQLTSSIDSAIKRVDTFNQYPKVLEQFGVSADAAKKSIDRIDKSVRGLPTSLDQAVSGVQKFFMVTNDLEKSEKLFQAVNDSAMIFAQGSADAVERFQYAYSQSLAAGKVDAANFRQMNEAIPGVMAKVAASMGLTMNQLKDGLSKGSISMDQFNAALVKLDTEGGAGMTAMSETARSATGGIQTSITNMSTAITRGWGNVLNAIGTDNIAEHFQNAGARIEWALTEVSKFIDYIQEHTDQVKIFGTAVAGLATTFAMFNVGSAMSALKGISGSVRLMSHNFKEFFGMMKVNPIIGIIAGIVVALALFFTKTEAGQKLLKQFGDIMSGVFGKIGPIIDQVIGTISDIVSNLASTVLPIIMDVFNTIAPIISDLISQIGPVLGEVLKIVGEIFGELAATAGPVIGEIVKTIGELAKAFLPMISQIFPTLVPMIKAFGNLFMTIGKSVIQIVMALIKAFQPLIPVIVNLVTTVAKLVVQLVSSLMPIIKMIIGIITTVAPLIAEIVGVLVSALVPIIQLIIQVIMAILPPIMQILEVVIGVIALIIAALMPVIDFIMQIVTVIINVIAGIISAVVPFITMIVNLITGLITTIINIIVTIINVVMGIITTIVNIITGIITVVTDIITAIINIVGGAIGAIAGFIGSIIDTVRNVLTGVFNFFKDIFTKIGSFVGGIVDKIVGFFKGIGKTIGDFIAGAFKGVINGALKLAEDFLNGPIKLINGAIDIINKIPGVEIKKITEIKLPRMAQGGILGGNSMTGDKQMYMGNTGEMVINRSDQSALWNAIKNGDFGGGSNVTIAADAIKIIVSGDNKNPKEIAQEIGLELQRLFVSQGLKPDLANAGLLR